MAHGADQHLFHAAFELRCGIEARMAQYLEVWDHISDKKKKGWRISDIARNVEGAFRTGNSIVRWAIHDETPDALRAVLYYTPVTARLQKLGEQLGNYLHSMKEIRDPADNWWNEFRSLLQSTASDLQFANTGTLLGPPLQKGSDAGQMYCEKLEEQAHHPVLETPSGARWLIHVQHLDRLPDPLEAEAYCWDGHS